MVKNWSEFHTLLASPAPHVAILGMQREGTLEAWLPEVHALFGVPQPPEHHPEIDTGVHTLLVVEQAAKLSQQDPLVVFAALVHDLGKGLTPPDAWPKHTDHETNGVPLVENVCQRLGVPDNYRTLAVLVCEYHLHSHRMFEMRPGSAIQWMEKTGILQDAELRRRFFQSCEADARGRTGFEHREYLGPLLAEKIATVANGVTEEPTRERWLGTSISAVKKHYAPYHDKEHVKEVVRRDNGLEAPLNYGETPAC